MPDSVLFLNNTPQETLLIVDFQALSLSTNFPGFSLPPGLHLILVTPPPSPLRIGRFIEVPEEATLLRYGLEGEKLVLVAKGKLDEDELAEAPHEFTQPILPHDFVSLSDQVSKDYLSKALGKDWEISTLTQPKLPDLEPSKTWNTDDTGSVRTERARDGTWYLLQSGKWSIEELRSALQFSFLAAALAGNPHCSLCWESLVRVMLKVHEGTSESIMGELWNIVFGQLRAMESVGGTWDESGLGDVVESEGWFVRGLRGLWRYVDEEEPDSVHVSVKTVLRRIKEWGEENFEWVVDVRNVLRKGKAVLEDGEEVEVEWKADGWDEEEYAPVVVEL